MVNNSHNRVPTSSFAIATMRRNCATNFHSASCPPLSLGGTMSTMLLEVRLTPCRHRIEIHHIRTDPPVATVDIDFFLFGNMTVVFACKPIHLKDDLFRATQLNHRFSEELIADESIVNVVIFLLATPLLKLICRVAGPSLCRSSGWRMNPARMRCTSFFCSIIFHKVSTCAVHNACAPVRLACSAL